MPSQHRYRLIGFRPPDDLRAMLERIAADRNEPLSAVVLRACWEYVNYYPGMDPSPEAEEG